MIQLSQHVMMVKLPGGLISICLPSSQAIDLIIRNLHRLIVCHNLVFLRRLYPLLIYSKSMLTEPMETVLCRKQGFGSVFLLLPNSDQGKSTSNKGKILRFNGINILDNNKQLLFCFLTFDVKRPL